MFDKIKFAQILKNINDTYSSQRDFAKKSEINRTYLSQYMNMKLNEPPKPKMLKKIADTSHGIITYEDLMTICGYIKENNFSVLPYYEDLIKLDEERINKYNTYKFSIEERAIYELFSKQVIHNSVKQIPFSSILDELNLAFSETPNISNESRQKVISALEYCYNHYSKRSSILSHINEDKAKKESKLFNIPVLGKIAAGQPILVDEYLEGYLPVDPNIYGMTTSDDYFYLKATEESMNLKIPNGSYALIHKQDYAENGDIIVAIVNGDDEATLKKYKKLNEQFVLLEPMSTDPTIETITVDLKNTKFQIIGKAIGQFGKF